MFKKKRDLTAADLLAKGPIDIPFLVLTMILLGVGLIMVFSASYASAYYYLGNASYYIMRQAGFALLGVSAMYIISRINYQVYRKWSLLFLMFSVGLLLLVKVPGLGHGAETVGAQRWLRLFGLSFQPSEVAKVAIIIYFAARLSNRGGIAPRKFTMRTSLGRTLNTFERIGLLELIPYGIALLSVVIPVVTQPHMSGTILILVGAASVLFAAGIHMGWFLFGGISVGGILSWIINNTNYMTTRIELYKDPWVDPMGDGFQIIQSLYAIGSGGLLGLGLGQSRQKFLYVPEPENDFIFPIVVEELGFIGALVIILLFMMLILRGYWLALHARDRFGALLIVGIITLLGVQVFFNIGVVTKLLPTTGISLPFFSFGGTALMIQLGQMGIILAISRQIPAPKQD